MKIHGKHVLSTYLGTTLPHEGHRLQVFGLARSLRPFTNQFDAIAYRGMSGGLVAPSVAMLLKKDLVFVRKDLKQCHSFQMVEGVECDRYVIVDDFVTTGDTVREIVKAIAASRIKAKLVGIGLYTLDNDASFLRGFAEQQNVWIASRHNKSPFHPKGNKC